MKIRSKFCQKNANLILLSAAFGFGTPVDAAVLTVTSPADAGPGTLRAAIAAAAPAGDSIEFAASLIPNTITLTTGELLINKDLAITGPGATNLAIVNFSGRVFHVAQPAVAVTISGLRLTGQLWGANGADGTMNHPDGYPGDDAYGGGILNESPCLLFVNACLFENCKVTGGKGGKAFAPDPDDYGIKGTGGAGGYASGGAIDNAGDLILHDCTLVANSSTGGNGGDGHNSGLGGLGGGADGGALQDAYANNDLNVANCTFTANLAVGGSGGRGGDAWGFSPGPANGGDGGTGGSAAGGAVYIAHGCPDPSCSGMVHCTIHGNACVVGFGGPGGVGLLGGVNGATGADGSDSGCGLFFAGAGLVPMEDTIIARNFQQPATAIVVGPDVNGFITSRGHNLLGFTEGSLGWVPTDLQGSITTGPMDPLLGPLQYNNLGPTPTMAPFACSPAIDAGTMGGFPADQIGQPRPVVARRIVNAGDGSDIGAFELQSFPKISLSFSRTLTNLTLSWPAPSASCFLLQETTNLAPAFWVNTTNPVSVAGGQNQVIIAPLIGNRFYRLIYP